MTTTDHNGARYRTSDFAEGNYSVPPLRSKDKAFVIRIWHEYEDYTNGHVVKGHASARGVIEDIDTQEKKHFVDLGQAIKFITDRVAISHHQDETRVQSQIIRSYVAVIMAVMMYYLMRDTKSL